MKMNTHEEICAFSRPVAAGFSACAYLRESAIQQVWLMTIRQSLSTVSGMKY
jgi:hypothetical protein